MPYIYVSRLGRRNCPLSDDAAAETAAAHAVFCAIHGRPPMNKLVLQLRARSLTWRETLAALEAEMRLHAVGPERYDR
jgi:hypothetical protein